jgi:His-Xaa-Ser system radical SAM maturase HxsC
MLTLSARKLNGDLEGLTRRVFRVTENPNLPTAARRIHALLHKSGHVPESGFGMNLIVGEGSATPRTAILPSEFAHLRDGDIIRIDSNERSIRVLYRKESRSNSLLVTERCNHYCVMCSQPPREVDDSYIVRDLLEAVPLMDPDTTSLGITGGEPTLLGDSFLTLLRSIRNNLPDTSLHILSNGRNFKKLELCQAIAEQSHRDLMFGIPVYSADPEIHNYVVQSENAWSETLEGIINLKRVGIRVEIRVVMHRDTVGGLENLAEFIRRNLTMVDHVAFMGLERMGFGATNWNYLFVNPREYAPILERAVRILDHAKINTSIYNTPLCMLPDRLHRFALQSISDWKNDFPTACEPCSLKHQCAGFFSSTVETYGPLVKPKLSAA